MKVASCDCGTCRKCKARLEQRYRRQRNKGDTEEPKKRKYRGFCDCGKCALCVERKRVRAYYAKKRMADANGVPMENKRQERANATRERKEMFRQQWAELARRRRENPLSDRQKEEVQALIREQLQIWLVDD